MRSLMSLLTLTVVALTNPACANGGDDEDADPPDDAGGDVSDEDVDRPIPPEIMFGTYDVNLFGVWEGMCILTLARNAELRDLHAEREGWVSHNRGIYYTDIVEVSDGVWTYTFEVDVNTTVTEETPDGVDHQLWAFEIPEASVTEEGFEGGYTHTSQVIGVSTGTTVASRRP